MNLSHQSEHKNVTADKLNQVNISDNLWRIILILLNERESQGNAVDKSLCNELKQLAVPFILPSNVCFDEEYKDALRSLKANQDREECLSSVTKAVVDFSGRFRRSLRFENRTSRTNA